MTIARAASDTFAGIRPADVPGFIVAQLIGAMAATWLFNWLVPAISDVASDVLMQHDAGGRTKESKRTSAAR